MDFQCPSCGAPIRLLSAASVYTTCTYCKSTVVRHDLNLELYGKVSELLSDMSPFQVGTRGSWGGKPFTLVGRVKAVYDSGNWSEWYVLYDTGETGWLAEAMGFYMISHEEPLKSPPHRVSLNTVIDYKGVKYTVHDIREVKYAASEGELPYRFNPGQVATSIDLHAAEGGFANLVQEQDQQRLFIGKYADFGEFGFTNLRELDGWKLN